MKSSPAFRISRIGTSSGLHSGGNFVIVSCCAECSFFGRSVGLSQRNGVFPSDTEDRNAGGASVVGVLFSTCGNTVFVVGLTAGSLGVSGGPFVFAAKSATLEASTGAGWVG